MSSMMYALFTLTFHLQRVMGEYEKVYTSTIDPDVAKMETVMDQWCLDLKRNILVSNMVESYICTLTFCLKDHSWSQQKAVLIIVAKLSFLRKPNTLKSAFWREIGTRNNLDYERVVWTGELYCPMICKRYVLLLFLDNIHCTLEWEKSQKF